MLTFGLSQALNSEDQLPCVLPRRSDRSSKEDEEVYATMRNQSDPLRKVQIDGQIQVKNRPRKCSQSSKDCPPS